MVADILFLACSFAGRPTLPELLRFTCSDEKKINIAKQIGDEYKTFGTLLLNDDNGKKVTSMESRHHSDPSKINMLILEEWLNGSGEQPVTWATLTEVLCDSDHSNLANDISTVKCWILNNDSIKIYAVAICKLNVVFLCVCCSQVY